LRVASIEGRFGGDHRGFVVDMAKFRSGLSYDAHRLPGCDMRTAQGRRWRDIVDGVVAEWGPATDPNWLREMAALRMMLEQTQAQVVNGGDLRARDNLLRLSRLIERREDQMRSARATRAAISEEAAA
jgi:hypothetical protein